MRGASNINKTLFDYRGLENKRVEKDSDIVMQRKINVNGQKGVVFDRVANRSFREKINNFLNGFRRASPDKMQQFFESRGMTQKQAHSATCNILDNRRSATSFNSAILGNQLQARAQFPDE